MPNTAITQAFLSSTKYCKEYQESIDIVKKNSTGKIFLIGGFVYRNIASELYGTPRPEVDLDYLVEHPVSNINLPNRWKLSKNRFGNYKFIGPDYNIDFVPLGNILSIKMRGLSASIENYLTGVPLTIQSIVFDVYENKLFGGVGISAIKNKHVSVYNLEFAKIAAQKKGLSVEEMVNDKAQGLGFKAIF